MDEYGALSRLGPILSPYSLNPCLFCPLLSSFCFGLVCFSLSPFSLFFGFWIRRAGLDVILSDIVLLLPPFLFHFNQSNRPTAFCGTQPSPPKTTTQNHHHHHCRSRTPTHASFATSKKNLRQPIASRPVALVYYFYRLEVLLFFHLIPHIDRT